MYSDRRTIVFLVIALVIALVIGYLCFAQKTPQESNVGISGAFLYPLATHYIDYYASNRALIDCLIKYESGGNPEAVGDHGTSFGILQFKKSTFQNYCVEQYGYRDDLMNPEIQRLCAGEMIANGGINHWTTKHLCHTFVENAVEKY